MGRRRASASRVIQLPSAAFVAAWGIAVALLLPTAAGMAQTGPLRGAGPAAESQREARDDSGRLPSSGAAPAQDAVGLSRDSEGTEAAAGTGATSVRPRGETAPVDLQPSPTPPADADVEAERSDSPTRQVDNRAGDRKRPPDMDGRRVWPLRPEAFTFTQAFGCVPQIGNYYAADPGCPETAPVVHTGVDLAAPLGTRFYAAASGWVTEAGLDRPEGLANTRIVVQHDGPNEGYATEYLHWIVTYVAAGDYVRAGEPLGEVGSVGYSTGPHLHFGVTDFAMGEPIDPLRWLPTDRSGGAYAGLAPNAKRVRFENVSANLPDYADPAPPPVPRERPVPDRPPGESADERVGDRDGRKRTKDRSERGRAEASSVAAEPAAELDVTPTPEAGEPDRRPRRKDRDRDDSATATPEAGAVHADPTKDERRANRRDRPGGRDGAGNGGDEARPDQGRAGGGRGDGGGSGRPDGGNNDRGRTRAGDNRGSDEPPPPDATIPPDQGPTPTAGPSPSDDPETTERLIERGSRRASPDEAAPTLTPASGGAE